MLNAEFQSFSFEIQNSLFDIPHFSIHCALAFKIAFIHCQVNNFSKPCRFERSKKTASVERQKQESNIRVNSRHLRFSTFPRRLPVLTTISTGQCLWMLSVTVGVTRSRRRQFPVPRELRVGILSLFLQVRLPAGQQKNRQNPGSLVLF